MFGILVSGWVQPPGTSSMCLVFAACTHSSLDRTMVRFTADTTGTAAGRLPALLVYLVHTEACLGGCTPHTHTRTHTSHILVHMPHSSGDTQAYLQRMQSTCCLHIIFLMWYGDWRLEHQQNGKIPKLTLHGKSVTKNRREKNNNHNSE